MQSVQSYADLYAEIPGGLPYEKDRGGARRTRGQEKSFWYLLGC